MAAHAQAPALRIATTSPIKKVFCLPNWRWCRPTSPVANALPAT
jgi:hypothetical protein